MSTKKENILYNPYVETKLILNSLVINHAVSIEENIRQKKLEEIDLLIIQEQERQAKEAEDKLKNESKQSLVNNITAEETTLSEPTSTNEGEFSLENNLNEKPLVDNTLETPLEGEACEIINFDELRNNVELEFQSKLKKINSQFPFEVFGDYKESFENFNFYSEYLTILNEMIQPEDLFSCEFITKFFKPKKNYIPNFNSFNIKYILYMEDFLFSWFLQDLFQKKFRKFKKLKFKKWKFKKRKLRKLYALKKIRKFIRFKRFKKKHYIIFSKIMSLSFKFFKIPKNILVQKIPLTTKVLNNYNVEFFYKLNKKTKQSNIEESYNFSYGFEEESPLFIYSRNYHQKPYWKLRKSRILHWNLFYKKTIRKQRYGSFLKKFMKKYTKFSYDYTFLVNFFTKFNLSWTRTSKFPSQCKKLFFEKTKNIIKLPLFFNNFFNWRFLKRRNYILKKKIGRWSFLNFKRFKFPWLQRKKNTPKNVNHIQPSLHSFLYLGNLDKITGYLMLNSEIENFTLPVLDTFKSNYLIKLHMYRYKSNNKWI